MRLSYEHLKDIPVFRLDTAKDVFGLKRVTGASQRPDGWILPAFYPLGMWAIEEFDTLMRGKFELDEPARRRVQELEWAKRRMAELDRRLEKGLDIDIDVPSGWFNPEPFAHQRYGIARTALRWRDYLHWDMGTGKTKTAVELMRLLKERGEIQRTFVLAPPVVLPTWKNEVRRHSQDQLKVFVWDSALDRFDRLEQARHADIVVTSYSRLRDEYMTCAEAQVALDDRKTKRTPEERAELTRLASNQFEQLDYQMIVADEIHTIANWDSQTTIAAIRASMKAKRRIGMTGTPGDRPERVYSQLRFLAPGLMPMGYDEFKARYVRMNPAQKYLVKSYAHIDEINGTMNRIVSHMKKAECLTLPPLTVVDIPIVPGPRQIARYNELVATMKASNEVDMSFFFDPQPREFNAEEWARAALQLPNAAVRLVKLLQVASGYLNLGPDKTICDECQHVEGCVRDNIQPYTRKCKVIQKIPDNRILRDFENPKLETARYYLEQIMGEDPKNKVLIWCLHTDELADLEKLAKELKIGYVRVDGSNTSKIQEWQDKFQLDPNCRIYLGQVASGVGVTLTAANYAIYYTLPYRPIHYRQAMERNNRPGQTRAMTVYRFMLQGTLDEFIARLLENKELIEYSMTELVACGTCDRNHHCVNEGTRPFQTGCKFQSNIDRLIAAPELIRRPRGHSPEA